MSPAIASLTISCWGSLIALFFISPRFREGVQIIWLGFRDTAAVWEKRKKPYPRCKVYHEIACYELNLYNRVVDKDAAKHIYYCQDRYGYFDNGEWKLRTDPIPKTPSPYLRP